PALHERARVSHEPSLVIPKAAGDRAPPGHTPAAAPPSRSSNDGFRPPPTADPIAASPALPTTTQLRGASHMLELIEAIRAALAQSATAEQKAIGAQACRTILTALDAQPGKPFVLLGAPKSHLLFGITLNQALDLAIARLTMIADARETVT